jgi:hypothetical protein
MVLMFAAIVPSTPLKTGIAGLLAVSMNPVGMFIAKARGLLTGALVFDGKTPVEMIAKHIHEEPVAPSKRAEQAVPPELDRLVLQCLAKKPEGRPADAATLARALAVVDAEPWRRSRRSAGGRGGRRFVIRRGDARDRALDSTERQAVELYFQSRFP